MTQQTRQSFSVESFNRVGFFITGDLTPLGRDFTYPTFITNEAPKGGAGEAKA